MFESDPPILESFRMGGMDSGVKMFIEYTENRWMNSTPPFHWDHIFFSVFFSCSYHQCRIIINSIRILSTSTRQNVFTYIMMINVDKLIAKLECCSLIITVPPEEHFPCLILSLTSFLFCFWILMCSQNWLLATNIAVAAHI